MVIYNTSVPIAIETLGPMRPEAKGLPSRIVSETEATDRRAKINIISSTVDLHSHSEV